MHEFEEEYSDFYDWEYFVSLEYRYFSNAHRSRIRNILAAIGDVRGKKCLDVGSGGGFFAYELSKKGADVEGIDYARSGVSFAKERFPDVSFRQMSAYDMSTFPGDSFDIVTLLDVIEHISDQTKALREIKRVLKPGGLLVIATDVDDSPWKEGRLSPRLIQLSQRFSADGRAYRLIKKVEAYRRAFKDYHASHIACLDYKEIKELLDICGFSIREHRVYPLVGVPLRDAILQFFPKKYRGDHQCVVAANEK